MNKLFFLSVTTYTAAIVGLAEDVAALRWYHTIDLPGGVVTPGFFDTRAAATAIPLPESLEGKRCLDVGTSDGFWAFEMERRGAAEVVAIDLPDPASRDLTRVGERDRKIIDPERKSRTFGLVHDALGSRVKRQELSVYDLSPEQTGTFDFVFMGSILVHLRDPVAAIARVRSVTEGQLLSYEAVSLMLSILHPRTAAAILRGLGRAEWWLPNKTGLRQMIRAGGFDIVGAGPVSFVKRRDRKLNLQRLRKRPLGNIVLAARGIAQSWVLARPGSTTMAGAVH